MSTDLSPSLSKLIERVRRPRTIEDQARAAQQLRRRYLKLKPVDKAAVLSHLHSPIIEQHEPDAPRSTFEAALIADSDDPELMDFEYDGSDIEEPW